MTSDKTTVRSIAPAVALAGALLAAAASAQAGSIYLTGHDVLLHGGQNGYDAVVLDYLRGAGTGSEIAKANYTISVVGSAGVGSARFTGQGTNFAALASGSTIAATGTLSGYGTATFYDAQTANWNQVLAADALIILSHSSCGGCSLTTAGSNAVNAQSAAIAAAFNAGMDIWGISGATLATYYDFLPAGSTATGASISGSTGFFATAAGTAIGLTNAMMNGFPTHNRFNSFAPVFTVMEQRTVSATTENISLAVRDASIGGGTINVPEPGALALLGLGLAGLGLARRKPAV